MEFGARVSEALLAGAEGSEVLGSFGNNVVVEGKVDSTGLSCVQRMLSAYGFCCDVHGEDDGKMTGTVWEAH